MPSASLVKPSMKRCSTTPSLPPNREYTFMVLTPAELAMRRTVRAPGPSAASRSLAAFSSVEPTGSSDAMGAG